MYVSYTPVEIRMAFDDCWKDCEEFEVEVNRLMAEGKIYLTECACINLKKCLRIKEALRKENKNE